MLASARARLPNASTAGVLSRHAIKGGSDRKIERRVRLGPDEALEFAVVKAQGTTP